MDLEMSLAGGWQHLIAAIPDTDPACNVVDINAGNFVLPVAPPPDDPAITLTRSAVDSIVAHIVALQREVRDLAARQARMKAA